MSDTDDASRYERTVDASQLERLRIGAKVRVTSGIYAGQIGVIVMNLPERRDPYVVAFGDGAWTYCGSSDLEPA